MNIIEPIEYNSSFTKSYFCHICKKEFVKLYIKNVEITCRFCGSSCCEETSIGRDNEAHPSHFQPYETNTSNINNRTNNTNNRNLIRTGGRFAHLLGNSNRTGNRSFLDMLLSVLNNGNHLGGMTEEASMDSIINYIMQIDSNRYGNPPASKSVVATLEKIEVDQAFIENLVNNKIENSCPVCKDEFCKAETAINLPCKHVFHEDCIKPWLQERNTCPTCRSELPTDDADFEKRKNSS